MTDNTNTDDTDCTDTQALDTTIAPTKTKADRQDIVYYLERLFVGAYQPGTTLQYHDYELTHTTEGVWTVHHCDGANPIDVLNVTAFHSATELQAYLDALADYAPEDRDDWQTHRAGGDGQ
ncbi:hypothetical protein [Halorussus caseinilyticus]|uniref:Uncharacterized protein n=1 Tax=Halorussus caseinilyticus TaxID=3034025 RepID=A0ABD5WN34_9EURY|nr:hypothetical protein [Halorussus sp. DT72]